MAKFCTKCGSELKNGKCPNCKEEKNKKEEVVTTSNNEIVANLLEVVKGTFTNPIETVKAYATSANFVLALILMAICAASAGIFIYVFVDEFMNTVGGLFGLGSLMSYGGKPEIPFGEVFIRIFLYIAVYQVVVAAMMLLMNKTVFKEETDIKETISIVGITSVGMACAFLVGAILFKIKFVLGVVMALVGMIFSTIVLTAGSMETLSLKKDKMVYSLLASISVGLFVILYVLPKLFN